MKIHGAKIFKEGINKNGKAYTIVNFKDENGRFLSSFDTLLLNVADGTDVDGSVSETSQNGKTYYNFTMAKEQTKPLNLAPVPAQVDQAVAKAPQAPTVPQDVWEKKDRGIGWLSCYKNAAIVFQGTGLVAEHIAHADALFARYEHDINGKTTLSENYAKVLEQVPAPITPPTPTDEPNEIDLNSIPF